MIEEVRADTLVNVMNEEIFPGSLVKLKKTRDQRAFGLMIGRRSKSSGFLVLWTIKPDWTTFTLVSNVAFS